MTWADIPRDPAPKVLRQFSAAWLLFFLALALHQYVVRGQAALAIVLAFVAVTVGGLGLTRPGAIRRVFRGCMMLAFPIGWVVSQTTLVIMFYGLITPLALFFRLRGRDLLGRKPVAGKRSLWIEKKTPTDLRRYFQQF
jgi:hypothetical protein